MSGDLKATPPPVMWAQRTTAILLTISVEDCQNPEIKIESDHLYFKGVGGADKKLYEVTIPFFHEINPEKSLHSVRGRNIEFVLKKKEDGPYWPHLTKEKVRYHWLKVDFNRWKDEEDSEDEGMGGDAGNGSIEEMLRNMGGLQNGAQDLNVDDLDREEDSDDGDLPDLE